MHSAHLSRREALLQLTTVALAGAAAYTGPVIANTFARNPFSLGVASGSPAADGFVLWTRVIDPDLDGKSALRIDWEVLESDSPRVVAKGKALAMPGLAYAVHVEVTGLESDRWYRYRFHAGGAVSEIGRTRTLPDPASNPTRLRFAYASCQRWEDGYYAAYRSMATEELDLVVFVGDYIYEYKSRPARDAVRTHHLPEAQTLQDYRDRYALYRSDRLLQKMHATCPWLVTWDDHEVENDYASHYSISGTLDLAARRIAAYQAFYEHMPLRASTLLAGLPGLREEGALRLYQAFDFGRLARLYVLDDRQYRGAPLCGSKPEAPLTEVCQRESTNERTMLGRAQEKWLAQAMEGASRAGTEWNFIFQQTGFTPRNYARGAGKGFSRDGWDGYWPARQRLIDTIVASVIRNPVVIGGDIHRNWVANVHRDPYDVTSTVIASEFCGTSISSRNRSSLDREARIRAANPHCLLTNAERRGYGVVEVTAKRTKVDLRVVEDIKREDSSVSTLSSFVVERDQPRIREAESSIDRISRG
ncbi:alkaline phosphatase D family protein [Variovorax sp. J22P271]|uniref:alkaline phosphatase D family protein n=1 Tax=Variovorax davisae TaxID=3053515 RepID=UPI0025778D11|nr:alkaline phosphatase D family protein [Variovorax sp. J22P271]MDM0034579.1 alkaline phosphatase D family protein [Variovorax sp. J22P271]